MATILPKKSHTENPIATDDEALELLINDPTVPQFTNNTYIQRPGFSSTQNINQSHTNYAVLTGAATTNAATNAEVLVSNDKESEHWVNHKWRPAMGWMYMGVCITDFVIFPILWSILQAIFKGNVTSQWQPLTLQGAGLFHLAMGAVLGIAAYGRTKEKIENLKS